MGLEGAKQIHSAAAQSLYAGGNVAGSSAAIKIPNFIYSCFCEWRVCV